MTPATAFPVLAGAAAALFLAALVGPGGLTLVAAPAALGLFLLALGARDSVRRPMPPRWVAVGAVAALAGTITLLVGATLAGLLSFGAGVVAILCGTQAALGFDGGGHEANEPLSLATNAAVAVDAGLQAAWQALAIASPSPAPESVLEDVRAAVERHRAAGILDDPTLAHAVPPALEKAHLSRIRLPLLGEVEQLSFESEFEPSDAEIRERYLALAPNRIGQATLLRHPDRPRPTLICVHGFGGGVPSLDARLFATRRLHHDVGLDVVQYLLPLHGHRASGRVSGDGFLNDHPLITNAAFGQAVWELRRITGWLRAQGAPAVGVMGTSLGGYTAALYASVERGLACAIPVIPAVSLVHLLRRDLDAGQRLALEAVGFSDELLSDAFAPHEPLRHRARVAPEGRLIVAGLADRICPPHQADALFEHWGRPSIHWFDGSHLVPLGSGRMRDRIDAKLRESLIDAAGPPPLTRFRSPPNGQTQSA